MHAAATARMRDLAAIQARGINIPGHSWLDSSSALYFMEHGWPNISGTVSLAGSPPTMAEINHWSDPNCVMAPRVQSEEVIARNGTLANVVVYAVQPEQVAGVRERRARVKDPLPDPDRHSSVRLTESSCMFQPHVTTATEGQWLIVENRDLTTHHVQARLGGGPFPGRHVFDAEQLPGAAPVRFALDFGTGPLMLTCALHPWEKAYVMVTDPSAASVTTRDDGRFLLVLRPSRTVGAGTYQVKAWHERYGTLETSVDVINGQGATVDFTFGAIDGGAPEVARSR